MTTEQLDQQIALGWCGPAENGIPRLARQIADAAVDLGFGGQVLSESDPARVLDLVHQLTLGVRLLHLHVNDWLFTDAAADPDAAVTAVLDGLRARGIALSVTLHDLPQPSDGPALYRRRAGTYRLLVEAASDVIVSSEHERALLREALGDADGPIAIIPLPIDPVPIAPLPTNPVSMDSQDVSTTVAIFGYLYPGKGHREVLDELASSPSAVTVLAIGRASDRHRDLVDELTDVAVRTGLSFRCTGYVPDSDVAARLRAPLIPVAPHTHISASGSINSWIGAGRRPLVPAGRYADELERRLPGAVWIYHPGELRGAVELAMADPARTWLPAGLEVGPTTRTVAQLYLNRLRERVGA